MNKKISYITLISDLYMLLTFSYIIYGIFFGFNRIGTSSFTIKNIDIYSAVIIAILEIIFSIIMAYLLHKCNYKKVRYIVMILCILNLIYRIINVIYIMSYFNGFIIFINIILFIILLLY